MAMLWCLCLGWERALPDVRVWETVHTPQGMFPVRAGALEAETKECDCFWSEEPGKSAPQRWTRYKVSKARSLVFFSFATLGSTVKADDADTYFTFDFDQLTATDALSLHDKIKWFVWGAVEF